MCQNKSDNLKYYNIMDYKTIIILFVLLLLIILIYRELLCLKDQIDQNMVHLATSTKSTGNDSKMNLDKYITQIKNISTENLQELKKITMLNHQTIINKVNHYSEIDGSDLKSGSHSEVRKNNKIFTHPSSDGIGNYYMSEDSKGIKASRYAETCPSSDSGENVKLECKIPLYVVNECDNVIIPEYFPNPTVGEDECEELDEFQLNCEVDVLIQNNEGICDVDVKHVEKVPSNDKNSNNLSEVKENVEKVQMKDKNSYSFNELKDIAKKLLLPITHKDGGKVKLYTKDALYNNIVSFHNKK